MEEAVKQQLMLMQKLTVNGKNVDADVVTAYTQALSGWGVTTPLVPKVFSAHLQASKFWPTIFDLKPAWQTVQETEEREAANRRAAQYQEVLRQKEEAERIRKMFLTPEQLQAEDRAWRQTRKAILELIKNKAFPREDT